MGAGWESEFRWRRKGLGKSKCTYDEEETEETEADAGDEKLLVLTTSTEV